MKKCPHCKAEIEENARFCLYCMTSLDEKQTVLPPKRKWPLPIIAAVMLLGLILLLACCVGGGMLRETPHGKTQSLTPDEVEMHDIPQPSAEISSEPRGEQEKYSAEPQVTEDATTPVVLSTPPVQINPTEAATTKPPVQTNPTEAAMTKPPVQPNPTETATTKPPAQKNPTEAATTKPPVQPNPTETATTKLPAQKNPTEAATTRPTVQSNPTEAATTKPPVQSKPTEQTKPAGCSHQYQLTTTRMPSCTTEGVNTYTCSRCGDSYQNTLSATGHSYQAPTCLLPQVCTVCNATGTAALGHSYQNGSCSRCGKADPSDPRMVYEYREARANDPLIYGTWDPKTDIIITGIKQTAEDGIYEVPSYIGGKRVVGILSLAFSGADARKVTLADTIFYVGQNAFSGCFNLEALYICGDALFLSRSAFVSTATRNCGLTIYCDAHCMVKDDLKGECYLKDIVRVYGAQYHQWNG